MRTTLNLDETLLRKAKERAARQGTTLTRLLETALRDFLQARDRPSKPFQLRVRTCASKPVPGVDFADRESLYQRMEEKG